MMQQNSPSDSSVDQALDQLTCGARRSSNMQAIGADLLASLPITSVEVIPLTSVVTKEELRVRFPDGPIFACDFYVEGAEQEVRVETGYIFEKNGIISIDHHAEAPQMFRPISSGNLAITYVTEHGAALNDSHVVISHTDCDSVITALIMRGLLPPDNAFGDAVISADHTGVENPIADLLQAIDRKRDLNFSARNLGLLLTEQPLDPVAARYLAERMSGRLQLKQKFEHGDIVRKRGPLSIVALDGNLRNEFLPELLPDAVVIMTFEPGSKEGQLVIRMRLGAAAPEGFTLFNLGITAGFDAAYGGRWNAGSNKRGGGTMLSIEEYTRGVEAMFERSWNAYEATRAEHCSSSLDPVATDELFR